jgi:hypothetical protein
MSTRQPRVPFTRTLPHVLVRALAKVPVQLSIATVVSVPSATTVRIDVGGTQVTVPRLSSYHTPTPGKPVYLLVGATTVLAIGDVGGSGLLAAEHDPDPEGG